MSAAVFGLVGVFVGGLITLFTTFYIERWRGWLAARTAALLTYDDLEEAKTALGTSAQTRAINACVAAWDSRRKALLYRRGFVMPNGLDLDEWLELGRCFRGLKAIEETQGRANVAEQHIEKAQNILEAFRDERWGVRRLISQIREKLAARRAKPSA